MTVIANSHILPIIFPTFFQLIPSQQARLLLLLLEHGNFLAAAEMGYYFSLLPSLASREFGPNVISAERERGGRNLSSAVLPFPSSNA